MLLELIVVAAFLAAAFLFAVPRITRLPGLPAVLRFEEVPDSSLSAAPAAHLARLDAQLDGLRYRPVFNIRVANLPSANLSRFYTSDADPALLLTSLLRVQVPGAEARHADYVEMITRYRDGTELATSNSPTTSPFARLPNRVVQRFPNLDPLALKERHDRAAAPLAVREALWHRRDNILDRWQESHRQWCEYQVKAGLLRRDPQAQLYRPSRPAALRGIVKFLNPLGGAVTPSRLLLALVFGSFLPSAALLALRDAPLAVFEKAAVLLHLSAAVIVTLARGALLLVPGLVAGRLFGQKHFVGGLVLGLLPVILLGSSSLVHPLLAIVIILWTARQTSAWVNRRRQLL